MKHRIKIRVVRADKSRARLAFEIDEAGAFTVHAQSAGFERLEGQGHYFTLFVEDYTIWADTPEGRQRVEAGLKFRAGKGTIEFLEVPAITRPPVEESTRMVTLETNLAANMAVETNSPPPESVRETSGIALLEHHEEAAPIPISVSPAPAPIPISGLPAADAFPQPVSLAIDPSAYASVDLPPVAEGALEAQAAHEPHEEPKRRAKRAFNWRAKFSAIGSVIGWFVSVAISLAIIAGLSEFAAHVIALMNPAAMVLKPGMGAAAGAAAGFLIALFIRLINGRLGFPAGRFRDSLRTLAFGSVLHPIWALSFGFPPEVSIGGALVAALLWVILFRFRSGATGFRKVCAVSIPIFAALMGAGYTLYVPVPSTMAEFPSFRSTPVAESVPVIPVQAAPVQAAPVQAAPVQAAPEQAAIPAPSAPVAEAAPVAPVTPGPDIRQLMQQLRKPASVKKSEKIRKPSSVKKPTAPKKSEKPKRR